MEPVVTTLKSCPSLYFAVSMVAYNHVIGRNHTLIVETQEEAIEVIKMLGELGLRGILKGFTLQVGK